jgi:hypothetical protein
VAISLLDEGDLVWSIHGGEKVAVPIVWVNLTRVENHKVVAVQLGNGATIEMSRNHPTADGRPFEALTVGESMDGQAITGLTLNPYPYTHTFDILPDSDTGIYFTGGFPVGSTLHQKPMAQPRPLQGIPENRNGIDMRPKH